MCIRDRFNSAAMKILGVDKNTPSAEGGFIEKAEDGTPTGYMEEADFVSDVYKRQWVRS